jgi:hypothetical protein
MPPRPPRWLILTHACGAAVPAGMILYEESLRGFPDSHLTAYDLAVRTPSTVLGYLGLALAAYFTYLGTLGHRSSSATKLGVAAALFVLLLLLKFVALNLYYLRYLQLDHGQGG